MEILHTFGFEWQLFVAQIINFLILAFIFKKFLYKPILKVLKDREKKIKKGLSDAEDAAIALAAAEEKKDAIMKAASIEAEKMIADTKHEAEAARDTIINGARTEAEKILAIAATQAKMEMDNMEKKAKGAGIAVAEHILDSVLSGMFTKQEKAQIMERSMKTVKAQSHTND